MPSRSGKTVPARIRVGCAGWRMPPEAGAVPDRSETHLHRYAGRFSAVEINSSFYRPHRQATYAKWAASVGDGFAFSVKVPKLITHEHSLAGVAEPLTQFLDEVAGLGPKLGCLLVQLPAGRERRPRIDASFFRQLRKRTDVDIVCEARHPGWFDAATDAMLAEFSVARVIADPLCDPRGIGSPTAPPATYLRLHGTPRIYYSEYDRAALDRWRLLLTSRQEVGDRCWCIFDNTAAGFALANATQLVRDLGARI
jgi:uncharacterized protein YecE (DUF72 family)